MAPPPSSLLRDLLEADGFKNRRKPPGDPPAAAPRTVSMPLEHRRPRKPARSQSDVLTRSRLRERGVDGGDDGNRDGAGEPAAMRRASASLTGARSFGDRGSNSGAAAAAIPALDESALTALISLAVGAVKRFLKDEGFRAALRGGCASCLGDSNHRAVLDLRVVAQTVERAAREGLDPRDLKRASLKLHAMASLEPKEADAVTAAGFPYSRLAACAHLYISVVSKLQNKDHSSAVHALEVFCLAPREARTALLPAMWDRLFRSGLSHLRAWRDREAAAALTTSDDVRAKEVDKTFVDVLDDGTRALACYYRDWLLGLTQAMALPAVPAPPSTVLASAPRCSTSTSYDISSDVAFSSGSTSPARFISDETLRLQEELHDEYEEEVNEKTAEEECVLPECSGAEADELSKVTPEPQVEGERIKESDASTSSYQPVTLEFITEESLHLQNDTDSDRASISATAPSDFLCPLKRQIFSLPVTIETGQTFERHAIVQWFDKGMRVCPVTGQELESLSIPDTNRVLKRLIDKWRSEHCNGLEQRLDRTVIDEALSSVTDMSEQIEKARQVMAIGGMDLLLRRFQEAREEDEKARAAEHLLLCIRAEGSCRSYVAIRLHGSSVVRLLHSKVVSARSTAVRLLAELLCLRREMVEMFLRVLRTELTMESLNVLLEHMRSSPVEEQALVAVVLLHFDFALVEQHRNSMYREEAVKIITHSLRSCLSEDSVVPNTRRALLLLGGHFSFSGDLLAEDWMLKQAGFAIADSAVNSDAVVQKEADGNDAWLRNAAAALLGGGGRRAFLDALSRCLVDSPDADLVAACLTTAGWLSGLLATLDAAADMQLAAFSALVPRLKQCMQLQARASLQARHRVLASVTLLNFSKIPDCRALLLMLLGDGLRRNLADLAGLTWTAGQLSTELRE